MCSLILSGEIENFTTSHRFSDLCFVLRHEHLSLVLDTCCRRLPRYGNADDARSL